jgi:hypothetical protein
MKEFKLKKNLISQGSLDIFDSKASDLVTLTPAMKS